MGAVSNSFFKDNIGEWGGRETCMGEPEDGFVHTNYFFVLESGIKIDSKTYLIIHIKLKSKWKTPKKTATRK